MTKTPENLITQHLNTWTQAIETKSPAGRGSSNKFTLVGIKKLRELILEMAVRGLLVPQDSNDEPANVLLEKIATEKAQLIKEGKIKKTKALTEISEDQKLYELPSGWEFSRIGGLLNRISNGFSGKQVKFQTDFPVTRIETISQSEINYDKTGFVEAIPDEKKEYYRLCMGDILLSHINSDLHVGKTAIKKDENLIYHGTNLILLRFNNYVDSSFYNLLLNQKRLSGYFLSVAQHAIGQSSINQGIINGTIAVVPPLEEQKRIVAKVDELMALCDQLEQQTLNSIEVHQTLVETLLNELVNPNNNANVQIYQAWSLISENFDVLFTTEKSIDTLKQTILQLAVMGKLVPQNPNDEPASKLLEKIATEKAQLIKDKKIKKTKPLPEITEAEKPFELPNGWSWVRFENIAKNENNALKAGPFGSALKKQFYVEEGFKIYGQEQVISGDENYGDYYINEEKYLSLESCKVAEGDILISLVGTIGKVLILSRDAEKGIINPRLVKLSLNTDIERQYIKNVLASPLIQSEIFEKSHGSTMSVLNLGLLKQLVFPLPPKEEQASIVAKVNALMIICDQLKTQMQSAQQTQTHLAQSIAQETLK